MGDGFVARDADGAMDAARRGDLFDHETRIVARGLYSTSMRLVRLSTLFVYSAATLLAQTNTKHPFTAEDWSTLRSAQPHAVSADGQLILYTVDHGAAKGPTLHEWVDDSARTV